MPSGGFRTMAATNIASYTEDKSNDVYGVTGLRRMTSDSCDLPPNGLELYETGYDVERGGMVAGPYDEKEFSLYDEEINWKHKYDQEKDISEKRLQEVKALELENKHLRENNDELRRVNEQVVSLKKQLDDITQAHFTAELDIARLRDELDRAQHRAGQWEAEAKESHKIRQMNEQAQTALQREIQSLLGTVASLSHQQSINKQVGENSPPSDHEGNVESTCSGTGLPDQDTGRNSQSFSSPPKHPANGHTALSCDGVQRVEPSELLNGVLSLEEDGLLGRERETATKSHKAASLTTTPPRKTAQSRPQSPHSLQGSQSMTLAGVLSDVEARCSALERSLCGERDQRVALNEKVRVKEEECERLADRLRVREEECERLSERARVKEEECEVLMCHAKEIEAERQALTLLVGDKENECEALSRQINEFKLLSQSQSIGSAVPTAPSFSDADVPMSSTHTRGQGPPMRLCDKSTQCENAPITATDMDSHIKAHAAMPGDKDFVSSAFTRGSTDGQSRSCNLAKTPTEKNTLSHKPSAAFKRLHSKSKLAHKQLSSLLDDYQNLPGRLAERAAIDQGEEQKMRLLLCTLVDWVEMSAVKASHIASVLDPTVAVTVPPPLSSSLQQLFQPTRPPWHTQPLTMMLCVVLMVVLCVHALLAYEDDWPVPV